MTVPPKQQPLPTYREFIANLHASIQNRQDTAFEICEKLNYVTPEGEKEYDFIKISSNTIRPTDKILLIRAGIHGDETAGPLTIMNHVGEIFDYAHERGIKLIVYPLDNPSGFEARCRYNIEQNYGDGGNNDFIRYELPDGHLDGDLRTAHEFKSWFWSSDPKLNLKLPKETLALHTDLKKLPLKQVHGCLDLHQDNFLIEPASYHYVFDDCSVYWPIIEKIKKISPVLAHAFIDSGYLNSPGFCAEVVHDGKIIIDPHSPKSDEHGCIQRHDGTLPDLLYRLGARYCVTVETTGITQAEISDEVNLMWVRGLVDLVADV